MSNKPGIINRRTRQAVFSGTSLGGGNCIDAPHPRLVSKHQIEKEDRLKAELYGDKDKAARAKVTLPKFSWDREGE